MKEATKQLREELDKQINIKVQEYISQIINERDLAISEVSKLKKELKSSTDLISKKAEQVNQLLDEKSEMIKSIETTKSQLDSITKNFNQLSSDIKVIQSVTIHDPKFHKKFIK